MVTLALIRDTFREALARKIFWVLFGLSTLMILFFLFLLRIDIVAGASATVSLFGRQTGANPDVGRLVRGVYGGIATFLYTWGMFLAVFASAGLVPSGGPGRGGRTRLPRTGWPGGAARHRAARPAATAAG